MLSLFFWNVRWQPRNVSFFVYSVNFINRDTHGCLAVTVKININHKHLTVNVNQLTLEDDPTKISLLGQKNFLVSGNRPGENILSLTSSSRICIKVYIFNFKKQTNKQKRVKIFLATDMSRGWSRLI